MNVRSSCPDVESTRRSIRDNGKLSLGHALLRSVKSTHILHFLVVFLTKTTLVSHSL
jgi:hypothetical protein